MTGWEGNKRDQAAGFLLALLVTTQLTALGANGPFLSVTAAVANVAVALALLFLVEPENRFWRGAWPVLLGLGLMIGWAALPGLVPGLAAGRPAPDLFLFGLARFFGGCALLVAAGFVGFRQGLLRLTSNWLVLLGLGQIAIGLWLREVDPTHVWGVDKTINVARYTGTMINANANATASAALALVAFGRFQSLLREPEARTLGEILLRVLCVLTAIAGLGIVALSGSRTVLMLLLAALAALTLLDPILRYRLNRLGGALSVSALMAAGALVFLSTGHTALHRFRTLGADGVDRTVIWRHYAAVARDAPPFGYGLGSFAEVNHATIRGALEAADFGYINSAHNELIELVIEGGAIFAVLALVTGILMTFVIWRSGLGRRGLPLPRAAMAAILLIAGEAMVDIALDVPAVAALAVLLLGLLWGRSLRLLTSRRRMPGPVEADMPARPGSIYG